MTVSTDAILCYGILFDAEFMFPWDYPNFDKDKNEWWIEEICRYTPPFELFDKEGNYINGIEQPQEKYDEYFKHRRDFIKEHPCPINPVNYCSSDSPMYILAVPSSIKQCGRGYPEKIDINDLFISQKEKEELIEFCKKYLNDKELNSKIPEFEPQWYLASYTDM